MKRLFAGIVLAGMPVRAGVARADDSSAVIWGYGNNSCGKWLTEHKSYDQRVSRAWTH